MVLNLSSTLAISVTLVFLYVVSLAIYNVYFHPLSKYPGPKLWAAYRLPWVYYQLNGTLTKQVTKLHVSYGPVVRIAPDELAYISAQAWKDIYGFRPGSSQLPKDLMALPARNPGEPASILQADDAGHARVRRLIAHAFSAKALEEQFPVILKYVDSMIQGLYEDCDTPLDVVARYNWTTFDLIGDLAFGEPFGCLKDRKYHFFVKTILEGINGGTLVNAMRRYSIGWLLEPLIPAEVKEQFRQLFAYPGEKLDGRLKRGTDRIDFMSYIMRADKNQQEMDRPELNTNAMVLLVAGSETTASLLSAATYYLLKNPKWLGIVTTEVRDAFASDQHIDFLGVSKLSNLIAVLTETLRTYPPTPGAFPRKTLAGGNVIDGNWVPPNTTVGIFQWASTHSPDNFHCHDTFHPERWLPEAPADFADDSKEAMQPFSFGPRNCIGKNLAHIETRLIMSKILWHFDLSLVYNSHDWADQKSYVIWAKGPLMVKATPASRQQSA